MKEKDLILSSGDELSQDDEHKSHIDLGIELKLFFYDISSPGSCYFMPMGTVIKNRLIDLMRNLYKIHGYQEVSTPVMADKRLWEDSGHYEKYKKNMFIVEKNPGKEEDGNTIEFSLCPMNCPKHLVIFKQLNPSYRQLPLRLADFGSVHRNETSGSLSGLKRARLFHQDDGHIFCTREQIGDEIKSCLDMLDKVYKLFNFPYELSVSTRPEKFVGTEEDWISAETYLIDTLKKYSGKDKVAINEFDGAFYGPKIDIHVKDKNKKEYQLGTIQLDFNLPSRLNATYSTDDVRKTPVMIHRAIFGSLERMIAMLLEINQGNLPLWLSPRQIIILPITSSFLEYAEFVHKEFKNQFPDFNIEIDSKGSIPKRIRDAELLKFNYIFVLGKREMENKTVSIRSKGSELPVMKLDEAYAYLKTEMESYYKIIKGN